MYLIGYLIHAIWMLWVIIGHGGSAFLLELFIDIVQTVASCCLLYGVKTEHTTLVLVFVISTFVLAVLKTIGLVWMIVRAVMYCGQYCNVLRFALQYILTAIVYIGCDVYSVIVTRSYHQELRTGSTPSPA